MKIKRWIGFSIEHFHENHINKTLVLHLNKNNFGSKTDKTDYPVAHVAQTSRILLVLFWIISYLVLPDIIQEGG